MYTFVIIVRRIKTSVSYARRQVVVAVWPNSVQTEMTQLSVVVDGVDGDSVRVSVQQVQQHEQLVIDRRHTDYDDRVR